MASNSRTLTLALAADIDLLPLVQQLPHLQYQQSKQQLRMKKLARI
jgi:hypothetical protein